LKQRNVLYPCINAYNAIREEKQEQQQPMHGGWDWGPADKNMGSKTYMRDESSNCGEPKLGV